MYEETNLGPELDLTISLSDSDIDEILGIEHADIENLQDGYIDDAVDDFVEGSDRIPVKKKGLFSEIFKKSIKRRKPLDSVSEEDYPDEGILVDILAAEDPISLSEFNDILSNVFPDAEFEEEQIRMIEKALREYGIVLDEAENREKSATSSTNSPERPYFDFEGQDDPKIDKPSENPDMSQIEGSFFSNPEIQEDFDDYFRLTPDTKGQDISFLSYDKDQEVNNQEQKEDDRTEKLSMDDIEMVYPTREAKITVIDSDKSCFNSITDPVVNNTTLDGNKETDIINRKIFDQINVISQGISADNYDKDSTPDGFVSSYVTDRDTVTGNGVVPVTFNDPELHRYYASVPEEVTALKYMEAAMDGQRASEKKEASEKEPDTPGIEEGVYVRNNDSFKTVDYSSARADVSFGDAGIPEKTVMDGSAPKTQTCAASLRRRDADRVADFKVNSGYEEYSENIGRIVCGNINHTTTDIESEVTKGARDLQSSELVWWARTILAPIGASSVRDSITADGKVSMEAATLVEKYVSAGKLSINDLNVGSSEACERIKEAHTALVSEKNELKSELIKANGLLREASAPEERERIRADIESLSAKIRQKDDEIIRNEKSLKEQTKHDYNELREKLGAIEKEKTVLKSEISVLTKDIRSIENRMKSGGITPEKMHLLQKKLELSKTQLSERQSLADDLGSRSPVKNRDILKRHKELYGKFTVREAMLGSGILSVNERRYLASRSFFGNEGKKLYGSSLQKYLRSKGVVYAREHDISRLSAKDLERFIKGGKKNGLSKIDIEALRGLKVRNDRNRWAGRSGSVFPGGDRTARGQRRSALALKRMAHTVLRSDNIYGESYNRTMIKMNKARMATKIARISSELLRISWSTSLINRVNSRLIKNVKVRIKNSSLSKAVERNRLIRASKKQEKREVRRQSYKELMESVKKPANFMKQKARSVRNSFEKTKIVKGFNNTRDKVKTSFSDIKRKFNDSRPVKSVKKLGKTAKDRLDKVSSFASRAKAFLSAPLKVVAKIKNFWDLIKQKVIMLLGHIAILFVKFYIAFILLVLIINTIISLLGAISGYAEDTAKMMKEMQAKLINYPELNDMKEDIDWMLDEDARKHEEAVRIGEGKPINPYVTNGKTIDRYGSPEHWPGYTVHYLDAYGNEMPSDSTNARDVMALCVAMFGNEIGNTHGDWRDLRAMDDLIADMYELLSGQMSYEESQIYFCEHGCDWYFYHCNETKDYNDYHRLIHNGANMYENLVPLQQPFPYGGCCSYQEWQSDWQWVEDWQHYYDWHWNEDLEEWEDWGYDYDDGYWEDFGEYVTVYYCDYHHYVPICYGHKDIDIYITLYDIEYAIENRLYPAGWENKSYADQIRRFMEQGGWDNEMYVEWARNYYDGDWYGIYGIDVEKGCGFSKGRPLTDSEIKEILDRIGDITEARKEIVEFALNAVGKVGYQYGGKASGTGMGARFGSSTPDEKGRRNGLDCSGFVQWVYRSAIGVSVPGSTAGYSGYPRISKGSLKIGDIGFYEVPGSEDNHMGIYLGMDSSGNETWVHCSGSSGATYGTGNFKYYISLF